MESLKPVRLTLHAREQCGERGADETDVSQAIRHGLQERAKHGRTLYRLNLPFGREWQGRAYAVKQVAPVVAETDDEFVVITVYTFYF